MMPEIYEHLPGFQVTYKDGGLIAPIDGPTTGSVLIIGTATDGPVGEATRYVKQESAESIFGKYYNPATRQKIEGCTMLLSAMEAYNAGCRDIRLVRYGGTFASAVVKREPVGAESASQDAIKLTSVYNGSVYNSVGYKVETTVVENLYTEPTINQVFKIEKPAIKSNSWAGGKYLIYPFKTTSAGQILSGGEPKVPVIDIVSTSSGALDAMIYYKVVIEADDGTLYIRRGKTGQPVEFELTDIKTLNSLISEINQEEKCGTYLGAALSADVLGTDVALEALGETEDYVAIPNGMDSDIIMLEDLVKAINEDQYNNVVTAEVIIPSGASPELVETIMSTPCDELFPDTDSYSYLTGGTNFLPYTSDNYLDIYQQLHKIYELIGDYQVDSVVLTGVNCDDKVTFPGGAFFTNFGEQFANYCADVNERNYEMFGVIGMRPASNSTAAGVSARVKQLINSEGSLNLKDSNNYFRYATRYMEDGSEFSFELENIIDPETSLQKTVGQFINVVAMPELFFVDPIIGTYSSNGAAAYAGLVSSLNAESAPTNKIIPNAVGMKYSLSPSQLNDLTGFRYVTFRQRHGGAVVVTDGCTAASPLVDGTKSDYSRLSTLRITFAAVNVVRTCAEPFIGEPNEPPQHNALNTAIRSGLDKMKAAGAISDYRFNINATIRQKILGECSIDLELIPALELRRIRVSVALKPTF